MNRINEWANYYDQFDYFSVTTVRDGCQPRIMRHHSPTNKAVVLVHGLTDSPYFLEAIGNHFHSQLGYDVYMPLLHCHGLKEPMGMEDVALEEWKKNVEFSVNTAAETADIVSIGGLSTGGTLSFFTACNMTDNQNFKNDPYGILEAEQVGGQPERLIKCSQKGYPIRK